MPTSALTLIERGRLGEAIAPWWSSLHPRGCRRRAGFRDLPSTGPTHLYFAPDPRTSVPSLLEDLASGFYLIEPLGRAVLDPRDGAISVATCGFRVEGGRAEEPVGRVVLRTGVRELLLGICGLARDLTFAPLGAMVGAPTIRVRAVDLLASRSP